MKKSLSLFMLTTLMFGFGNLMSSNRSISRSGDSNVRLVSRKLGMNNVNLVSTVSNFYESNGIYEVYGNYSTFDYFTLKELVANPEKVFIFYDLDLSDNEKTDLEILRNNATIYYYYNGTPHIDTYVSQATNAEEMRSDVSRYINERIDYVNELLSTPQVSPMASMYDTFSDLYIQSFRNEHKPDGYIDVDYKVKKYRFDDVSSIYVLNVKITFTGGKLASSLGQQGYDNRMYNQSGYVKLKAENAKHEVGYGQIRYGGTPVYKDAYPMTVPSVTTIYSTYTPGTVLGYSYYNGFSFVERTTPSSNVYGLYIACYYNKQFLNSTCNYSTQKDPGDLQKYTWAYEYPDAVNQSTTMEVGYIFEMNNQNHDLYEGDLAFTIDYRMDVTDKGFLFFEEKYHFEKSVYKSYY